MKVRRLGEIEHLTLLAVQHLRGNAYGVTIRRELSSCLEREVSIGSVYASLDRLERTGLVTTRLGDPTPQRGGRAKRFIEITGAGEKALSDVRAAEDRKRAMFVGRPALGAS